MRCPDCNKFVSLDFQDPEVDNLEVDADGHVTCSVRLVRACADCGTELKEANLELEGETDVSEHLEEFHPERPAEENGKKAPNVDGVIYLDDVELSVEETSVDQIEAGGGRYKKSFFGAEVSYAIECVTCKKTIGEGTVGDQIAASHMDELV